MVNVDGVAATLGKSMAEADRLGPKVGGLPFIKCTGWTLALAVP